MGGIEETVRSDCSEQVHEANPIVLFTTWRLMARQVGLLHPDAMCLSTVTGDSTPDARIVDLKEFSPSGFVFCTHMQSPKAMQLAERPAVSLTFWWDQIERQVRVVGLAERISDDDADRLFAMRHREAQVTSWYSIPGSGALAPEDEAVLRADVSERFNDVPVLRPSHWGGFLVVPQSFEFLEFRHDRRHLRLRYEKREGGWPCARIQP